jgi:hypothetical protein
MERDQLRMDLLLLAVTLLAATLWWLAGRQRGWW